MRSMAFDIDVFLASKQRIRRRVRKIFLNLLTLIVLTRSSEYHLGLLKGYASLYQPYMPHFKTAERKKGQQTHHILIENWPVSEPSSSNQPVVQDPVAAPGSTSAKAAMLASPSSVSPQSENQPSYPRLPRHAVK